MTPPDQVSAARTDPVVVVAVFTPAQDHAEDLVDALRRGIPAVHAESGCEVYAIHDAGDTIVMIEKWADQASFESHRDGEASRRMAASVGPFLAKPVHIESMKPLPVGADGKNL